MTKLLQDWQRLPDEIATITADRSDDELAKLPGSEGLSLIELVHHITEANIVASTMIIAALGASGSTFDWSWLWPNKEWCDRLGYSKVSTAGSLETLRNMTSHIANVVRASGRGAMKRKVTLFDAPGSPTYTKTVAEIIQMELDHAEQHLKDARRSLRSSKKALAGRK